ncbi:flagellar export protein FliJ [Lentibacillus salicampi]|uniref:Flagellar FliJ protein n=1 Tax=Lentibacillus salicampi TaxID=175306 RepID=A0A4Y9AFS2_9BACI|nr:flagellar export protein FliJ [Lentibacillus salicampi]TFJ94666.1 flagellar export protein FliJ [Lentibacillus salicampi]
MAGTAAFSRILHVRENEKKNAQKTYQKSIDIFEEVATQLYSLLRKKETAEQSYEEYLQQTIPIDKIRGQLTYIEKLNHQIVELQRDVQKARNEMDANHERLNNAHVEVKKFEKIMEHRQEKSREMTKKHENESMDNISIQQYLSRKPGD